MAQTSTVHNFDVTLSHVDRNIYENLKLQVARHPSETRAYLLTRVIAYCAEFQEGISFSKGLSDADEPAVWAHDLTGQLTAWIEVGAPAAARLHKASKLGVSVAVYAHKDPKVLISQLAGEEIFQAEKIRIFGFSPGFIEQVAALIEKRTTMMVSISEGHLYLSVAGKDFESALELFRVEPKQP
jgi:uncharacterized protein YaeQ